MDLSRYVVEAVIREGRSYREVAAAFGVSKSWVAKLIGRFREGGYEALEPRSKAPHRIPAGRLHHIGVGRDHHRQRVIMLIAGLDIRIITPNGELLRHLTLDPSRDYQPTGRPPGPPKGRPLRTRKKKPPTLPPNRPR